MKGGKMGRTVIRRARSIGKNEGAKLNASTLESERANVIADLEMIGRRRHESICVGVVAILGTAGFFGIPALMSAGYLRWLPW